MQDTSFLMEEIDPRYIQFIQQTVQQRMVYTLQDEEGFLAQCPSEEHDDTIGEPVIVECFWGNKNDAQMCQQDEWQNFQLVDLTLDEFMYDFLLDMDADTKLVGVAFDAQLYGIEVEPIELLCDLLAEIKTQQCVNEFDDFAELQQICQQWQQEISKNHTIH